MRFVILAALLSFCAGVGQGLYYIKDGFSPRRIQSFPYPVEEEWDEETTQALQQPFTYIGRGRQCFAFASEDGKYVLKIPRTDIYKLPFLTRVLPNTVYRQRQEQGRQCAKDLILTSFQISFEDLKEQTALLTLHLGQSRHRKEFLTLIDATGCKYRLPLATTAFALQYKHSIEWRVVGQSSM